MKPSRTTSLFSLVLFFTVATASASQEPPDVTVDGLHRVPETQVDLLYALPGADLGQYERIYLLAPEVRFVKDYKQKANRMYDNRLTDADIARMRDDVVRLFAEEFADELQGAGGYSLVQETGEDVLLVRPAIIDLDVLAPQAATRPNARSTLPSAGRMTLLMELADSVSGAVLAKALDYQYDRTPVQTYLSNQARNEKAARQMLRHWASLLRQGLDEAHRRAGMAHAETPE